jgi:ribosomal protein S27AE
MELKSKIPATEANVKRCKDCGEIKSTSEFYRRNDSRDGLRGNCKSCERATRAAWYAKNAEKENERSRKWRQANPKYFSDFHKKWRENNPCKASEIDKSRRARNPIKYEARAAVNAAVSKEILVRQPCEVCASTPVDAHHDDYSKPLDVRWLCRKCHLAWHKENGPGLNGDEASQ